jgi:hypothetical protein
MHSMPIISTKKSMIGSIGKSESAEGSYRSVVLASRGPNQAT